jgi:farnesyl diphosphate synthase
MTQSGFSQALSVTADAIEARLTTLLADEAQPGEVMRPARLVAAMRHGALGGGKRLRPFLVAEAFVACHGRLGDPAQAGAGLELIHCYSLVHDDLPAMDDDALRRGRPTAHIAFDEATAILAGDSLLTLAFDVLADETTHPDASIRIELVQLAARASGLGGMAGGQMLDLAAEGRFGLTEPLDASAIRRLQAMKTGALIHAGVMMGAALAKAGGDQRKALSAYGRAAGAAFQIADDILDVESSADALGKATGKDAKAGKGTLVSLLGLDAARTERDRLVDVAIAALSGFGPEADRLRQAAIFIAQRAV